MPLKVDGFDNKLLYVLSTALIFDAVPKIQPRIQLDLLYARCPSSG